MLQAILDEIIGLLFESSKIELGRCTLAEQDNLLPQRRFDLHQKFRTNFTARALVTSGAKPILDRAETSPSGQDRS
jgi:hypothetical protein